MTPPPGSPWGQNPFPPATSTAAPPQTTTAWAPQTPTAWAPPPTAPTAALDNELQIWLIVTCAGWFVGFMWITGPLGWWKANDLRDKYAAMGAPEPSNVYALRLIGIVTTVLSVLGILAACGMFMFFGLFAAGAAAGGR
jgi:hypothetical protein